VQDEYLNLRQCRRELGLFLALHGCDVCRRSSPARVVSSKRRDCDPCRRPHAARRIGYAANGMRPEGPRYGAALRARATLPSVPRMWSGYGGVDDRRQPGLPTPPTGRRTACRSLGFESSAGTWLAALPRWKGDQGSIVCGDFRATLLNSPRRRSCFWLTNPERAAWSVLCFDQPSSTATAACPHHALPT